VIFLGEENSITDVSKFFLAQTTLFLHY